MKLVEFNELSVVQAESVLLGCCTSTRWASALVAQRPFTDAESLIKASDNAWQKMSEPDWLEAFDGHPQIGDVSTLKQRYRHTQARASSEQAGVNTACDETLYALAKGNADYLKKFGFIFIVFATGKSAEDMLDLLNKRLSNTKAQELETAAREQNKITRLRISQLF